MQVAKKKTGKEVWESLKARFVRADRVRDARLQTLKSEFDAMEMREEESLDLYSGKLMDMSVKYNNLGGTLDDTAMVKKLLDTVPERFINCVAGIEQFCDLKTLAFDEAVGRLKAFEERVQQGARGVKSEGSRDQALLTQAEWEARQRRSGGDSSGKGKSHEGSSSSGRGRGRGRGRGQGGRGDTGGIDGGKRDKSHIQCFKCKQYGHYANRCPDEKKDGEEARAKASGDHRFTAHCCVP